MIRAAFIGIDRYADPEIRDLCGAARDARALWAVFSDSIDGLQAELLTNEEASLSNVVAALDRTLDAATEDDIVLLGFAGHGTPDHRLALADTRTASLLDTTFGMDDLAARFQRSRAKAVLVLLDCCFSGGAPARVLNHGLIPRETGFALGKIAGKGRVLFAASAPDEEALEDPQSRHGLFTQAVIETLVGGSGRINILDLVQNVTGTVRQGAERLGYIQNPVMLGHIEGDLLLPAGRRGDHYYRLFPEMAPLKTDGSLLGLADAGVPEPVAEAWNEQYPSGLNALQIAAINDHGILAGQSLLVVAPTSAGKTFIGEMAAMRAVGSGQKVVFLLPYKALVNEKYEDFSALYGERIGLRVVRCSGDWQDQVGDVLRGKFDIAFFTYEKFLGMCVTFPHILHQLGLVVIDEAQFITDPHRGMTVELILTALLSARQRGVSPQLIALSAVIGNTNRLEQWLGCNLLVTTERPVPLMQGVIDRSGTWRFIGDDGAVAEAELVERHKIRQRRSKPSSQDVIVPLVKILVEQGEKVIVFRSGRGPSAGCATYLAEALELAPAKTVIESLPAGDPSSMSRQLRSALEGGVAFHTSDLSREERVAIERGFRDRDGQIKVLVATSTVAAGINTPASTVIIVETSFPGPEPKPYSVAQFKNMAGRAGRLGYEPQGKAIALSENLFERERLFRTYAQGAPEPMRSSFNPRNPGTWILRLLTQVATVPRGAVIDLLANTYGGFLSARREPEWRAMMGQQVDDLLSRMIYDGLIDEELGNLRLSILGRACGESPLSLESAMRLVEMLRRLDPDEIVPVQLLALAEALPERDASYTPQIRGGEPRWASQIANDFGHDIARLLRTRAESDRSYYARCKRALVIADWIEGKSMTRIEADYSLNGFAQVRPGDIRGYADGTRFLLDAIFRIAAIVTGHSPEAGEVENLLKRLELGLPAKALPLASLPMPLDRGAVLDLWQARLTDAESIVEADPAYLVELIGPGARTLLGRLEKSRREKA